MPLNIRGAEVQSSQKFKCSSKVKVCTQLLSTSAPEVYLSTSNPPDTVPLSRVQTGDIISLLLLSPSPVALTGSSWRRAPRAVSLKHSARSHRAPEPRGYASCCADTPLRGASAALARLRCVCVCARPLSAQRRSSLCVYLKKGSGTGRPRLFRLFTFNYVVFFYPPPPPFLNNERRIFINHTQEMCCGFSQPLRYAFCAAPRSPRIDFEQINEVCFGSYSTAVNGSCLMSAITND